MKNLVFFYFLLGVLAVNTSANSYDLMYYDEDVTSAATSVEVSQYSYEEQELLDAFYGEWLDADEQAYKLLIDDVEILVLDEDDYWLATLVYEVEFIDVDENVIEIIVNTTFNEGETDPDLETTRNMIYLSGNTMTFIHSYDDEDERSETSWERSN